MVIIVAAVIFVLDLSFKKLNQLEVKMVEKLQNTVETTEEVEETENETTGEASETIDVESSEETE